jgi:peptidoglycan/LPS O-acetylase OafA/YrhL
MTPRAAEAERPAYLLAPTARLVSHRPDIQGLRAIAVLMVVAFHAGLPVPGGFVGVDVFFVISGFVIAGSLHREWSNTGRIHFARFYMRRFKRLTPALALTVTVTMLLTAAVLSPLGAQQNAAKTAIGGMFISANVVIANTTGGYFSLAAETNPLLHVWSLSVEEQFYLGFPFLLAIGWAIARRGRRLSTAPLMLVMAVMAVSFLLSLVDESALEFPGSKDALGFYSPVPRAWEFAAGAALALAIAGRRGLAPRTAALSGTLGLIGLVSSLFSSTAPHRSPAHGRSCRWCRPCFSSSPGGRTRTISSADCCALVRWCGLETGHTPSTSGTGPSSCSPGPCGQAHCGHRCWPRLRRSFPP